MPIDPKEFYKMTETVSRLNNAIFGNGKPGIYDWILETRGALRFIKWALATIWIMVALILSYLGYRAANDPHHPVIGHTQTQPEKGQHAADETVPQE